MKGLKDLADHHPVAFFVHGRLLTGGGSHSLTKQAGPAQEKSAAAKDDNRLPFQREGWQFFVAPYLWIPGIHADISPQGQFSGTTIVDVPWYDIVPLLFSKAIGGMGRVEIWKGRWGLFSDTNFVYIGESVSCQRRQATKTEWPRPAHNHSG